MRQHPVSYCVPLASVVVRRRPSSVRPSVNKSWKFLTPFNPLLWFSVWGCILVTVTLSQKISFLGLHFLFLEHFQNLRICGIWLICWKFSTPFTQSFWLFVQRYSLERLTSPVKFMFLGLTLYPGGWEVPRPHRLKLPWSYKICSYLHHETVWMEFTSRN